MKHKPFEWCIWKWGAWFRIAGYGLHFKPRKRHEPLFSERYGYTRAFYLGPVRVAVNRNGANKRVITIELTGLPRFLRQVRLDELLCLATQQEKEEMGYTFKIGNAVPEFRKDDGYLSAGWTVQPMNLDDAPTFPHDEMTGNSNSRSPSYSVWSEFCKATGIYDVFYDESGHLHAGHPGCVMLKRSDLERVKEAREAWQKTATLPPGFEGWPVYDKETGETHTPDEGKYDYQLARLLWLEWWMTWALDNCETPAIENY